MKKIDVVKIVGIAGTVLGVASTFLGNWATQKTMDETVAKKVAEALKSKNEGA